jgi:hypothetical protein
VWDLIFGGLFSAFDSYGHRLASERFWAQFLFDRVEMAEFYCGMERQRVRFGIRDLETEYGEE